MSYAGTPRSRTTVVRVPDRGHYDRATIDAILDEGFVCHVAFAVGDQPICIPTEYVRSGDEIFVDLSPSYAGFDVTRVRCANV